MITTLVHVGYQRKEGEQEVVRAKDNFLVKIILMFGIRIIEACTEPEDPKSVWFYFLREDAAEIIRKFYANEPIPCPNLMMLIPATTLFNATIRDVLGR